MLGSGSRCGRSCSSELGSDCVDTWTDGVVVAAGQVWVERSSLSLVRALLRWNKPRLRNDIFSHPSNKLHIQQISGSLPNHFFPLQSLKKVACRIRLPRHNTEDLFFYFFYPRHHLPLCCNLELSKLLDVSFLLLICSPTYDQSVPHPFFKSTELSGLIFGSPLLHWG